MNETPIDAHNPNYRSAPHVKLNPLTPEQQALVLEHLPMAYKLAAWFSRSTPAARDDNYSLAAESLCRAAIRHDHCSGAPFRFYAHLCVTYALRTSYRLARPSGFRGSHISHVPCPQTVDLSASLPDSSFSVGFELESDDTFRFLLSKVDKISSEALWLYFLSPTCAGNIYAVGRVLGLTRSTARNVVKNSIEYLKTYCKNHQVCP